LRPLSRRLGLAECPPARWTIWCSPWGWPESPKAGSPRCAGRLTTGCTRSSPAPSPGNSPTCGWMLPTGRCIRCSFSQRCSCQIRAWKPGADWR
jgi:hypothetical protein